jgi:two-component system NtrC family sensor kinase
MAWGHGLRWRIVIILLLVSLLPLGLLGVGSWSVFGKLLEDKTLGLMRSIVESHAHSIETHLSERLHLLQILAETHSIEEMANPDRLSQMFDELNHASAGSFIDLGVIDSEGKHLAYIGPYDLQARNYRDADWFKEVMSRQVYISDVFLGFRQVPHCILAVKIKSGSEAWILRGTINSHQFDQLVRTGVLGETGDVYLVNREGLYQTTPRLGKVLDQAPALDLDFHKDVRDRRIKIEGQTKIRVSAWINDNRWMLVVEQDEAEVRSPVNQAIAKGVPIVLIAVVLLVITTIFATLHLTRQIDKANAQREEISRAFMRSAKLASIGELATGLAHEINNPLAVISAEQTNISDIIDNLENEEKGTEQILESVERCKRQVKRCASITTKMLQFGRKRDTVLEPTDIAARLNDIRNLLERQAGVRNIEFILEVEKNLPQVMVDAVEFEQVLVNLINNSFDALPNGGQIKLSAGLEKDEVHLAVADNGSGIDPDTLDRIFEPFFTSKPVGEGTGLGLSVCFGIVHSWGGWIEAESEPGRGTTMLIRLPLKDKANKPQRS